MTARPTLPRPDRCVVMGVLNVTEDSFSDGGRYLDLDDALAHAGRLVSEGADVLDVGGESTRPGAVRVDVGTEASRVVPVVRALSADGLCLSVDTMHAPVAAAALEAGATLVNDVSGGLADSDMARVVADAGCPWILVHWVPAADFDHGAGGRAVGADVVTEVREHLARRADAALAAGVDASAIVLDPGLGFAKDADDNWALLHGIDRIVDLGFPVLVAASRKRFLGSLLADADGTPRSTGGRDRATDAISALAAAAGAWGVRVHDVPGTVDAVRVARAWRAGRVED